MTFRVAVQVALARGKLSGRKLREQLAIQGFSMDAPTFFCRMVELIDDGIVTVEIVDKVVEGQTIHERWYSA